ncbi:hypothetical protein ACP275_08G087900 [Erythranthe tilingii]
MEFPRDKDQYVLTATIGTAEAATMHKAKHVNPATGEEFPVGIKIFRIDEIKDDIYFMTGEFRQAKTCDDHENTVNVHCSFKTSPDNHLWIVMTPLPGFSIRSVIRSFFRHGMPEKSVNFILQETLNALVHMHGKNILHRYIGADCIFPCGEEYSLLEKLFIVTLQSITKLIPARSNWRSVHSRTARVKESPGGGYPDWTIAPEFRGTHGGKCLSVSTKEDDVWMFGLLALELFYGRIPGSDSGRFEKLLKNKMVPVASNSRFLGCCLNGGERKEMPEQLREVVAACLSDRPEKRPTVNRLMEEYDLFRVDFPEGLQGLEELNKACKNMR